MSKWILVIEDDIGIREVLAELLELEGYSVKMATNGDEAKKILEDAGHSPCLAFLDLMMPVMDGWQFLRWLENSECNKSTQVVVMSAVVNPAIDSCANIIDVLKKPIELERILNTVVRYCD